MIKNILKTFLACAFTAGIASSCGEDRSGEYYALIGTQTWVYETMQQNYLYYEDLPAQEGLNFFTKPKEFLSSLISNKDQKNGIKFSHLDSIYTQTKSRANNIPSFGFDGAVVRIPNGSEAIRVIYTQKDSPAEEAQLKRGDWIIAADGKKINGNSYEKYIARPTKECSFTIGNYNGEGFDTLNVINMPAPRIVDTNNLLRSEIITSGNRKAFYMLYNEFGLDGKLWESVFSQLAEHQFDDIILDLRYNPGGYVSTAQVLTSNLAPADALNQPFLKMTTNDKINKTDTYLIDPKLLGAPSPIAYQNLYIITSKNTASASEIVINGLKPYMKGRIFQVGEATFGKNVAQSRFIDEQAPQVELWLTTFSLRNSEDFGDYFDNGLQPDYKISENLASKLGEFGTPQDELIVPILHHMANGTFPTDPEKAEKTRTSNIQILYNPIEQKPKLLKIE